MGSEGASGKNIPGEVEEVLNEAADNIDGTIALLLDVRGGRVGDDRLHAAIAALRHTRSILDPVLDKL